MRLGLGKLNDDALIFTTPDGQPVPPNNFSRDWADFVKARKLPPICFHSLRHSHASLLISSKLDPLTLPAALVTPARPRLCGSTPTVERDR